MNPADLCAAVHASGLSIGLEGNALLLKPAGRLSDELRAQLIAGKADLISFLTEMERITPDLIQAAMRACDHWGDGVEARALMESECRATPPHLRADLLAHFQRTYSERPRYAARG